MSEFRMTARPRLTTHARLQWDPVRRRQVLLAPERVLVLNETAAAILARCDGLRSIADISADLANEYGNVPEPEVLAFLGRLVDKRLIEVPNHE
jgi:pyrroloquinoline quinone biosynthesis protein D